MSIVIIEIRVKLAGFIFYQGVIELLLDFTKKYQWKKMCGH
mgnify:CR=1 FL=1